MKDTCKLFRQLVVLSSSRTSVRVKLGLFNDKIRNENRCYIHRLKYQHNEQDFTLSFYIEAIFDLGNIIAWRRFEVGQFRQNHSGKTRIMALFWLHTSYHTQRYMFQRYMLRSLLTQSFNVVNSTIILLFSKKWVPGFAAEDNIDLILG